MLQRSELFAGLCRSRRKHEKRKDDLLAAKEAGAAERKKEKLVSQLSKRKIEETLGEADVYTDVVEEGGRRHIPIFEDIMRHALDPLEPLADNMNEGGVRQVIDPAVGFLTTEKCHPDGHKKPTTGTSTMIIVRLPRSTARVAILKAT